MNVRNWNDTELAQYCVNQMYALPRQLGNCSMLIEQAGDLIPGNVMIQDFGSMNLVYMNQMGCNGLQSTKEELVAMGKDYYARFFPAEELSQIVRSVNGLLSRQDPGEVVSFYQRVRPNQASDYKWHFSSVKILKQQADDHSLQIILISHEVTKLADAAKKMNRLLEENLYVKQHYKKFVSLTKREKEIIRMLANGYTNVEIADLFFISKHTVNTHRKRIIEKLECRSFAELLRFALAFDLIDE